MRFAIEDMSGGREFEYRLMDFNNTRSFEEVKRVLAILAEQVGKLLRPVQ